MVFVVDQTLVMVSLSHGPRLLRVGPAAPDVDDRLPVEEDGDGGAEVRPRLELVGQRGADRFEARLAGSVHLCHGDPLLVSVGRSGRPGASGVNHARRRRASATY